jgi:Rhodopirellula transposase DDE domain
VVTAADREEEISRKFALLAPVLDERQRRLWMAIEAQEAGRGGITMVAHATGAARTTVTRGVDELDSGATDSGRIRRAGAGRKRAETMNPGLTAALERLVDPDVRGDPESPLRWTIKSTRQLSATLCGQGHGASEWLVRRLLYEAGYSLQAAVKQVEGNQHPDRDSQFRYINDRVREHHSAGQPVISVDSKKKELVGRYKNAGRRWQPAGQPESVNAHDFPDKEFGKAVPYGVYDLAADAGWVSVGADHDTAAFAVATIRRWWQAVGADRYPQASRVLITADAGGSNGYRTRLWKTELAALAAETGLAITVCHFPPGTSKWNKIEHRLFSRISSNWRGQTLTSHEVVVNLIAATTTRTGLTVRAELDSAEYPKGIKISDKQIRELEARAITRHNWHGEWNYSVSARADP